MQELDWNSINYYTRKKEDAYTAVNGNSAEIAVLKERLSRLDRARAEIHGFKDAAWDNRNDLSKSCADLKCQYYWSGEHHRECCNDSEMLIEKYGSYLRSLDITEDALISEMAGCKNKIADLTSEISWFEHVINDCEAWLYKLWN